MRYATSFFGIVDLLAVLPTYLALIFPELHAMIDVRVLRLLRVFRIFRLTEYVAEYQVMLEALKASRRKILVFLSAVIMVVLILGTLLYVVEGPEHGFTDIPTSMYWAVTTITTVGFGDITPKTDLGRLISSVIMLLGWGTLAVPTGIVTAEMTARYRRGRRWRNAAARNAGPKVMGLKRTSASIAVPNCPRWWRLSLQRRRLGTAEPTTGPRGATGAVAPRLDPTFVNVQALPSMQRIQTVADHSAPEPPHAVA